MGSKANALGIFWVDFWDESNQPAVCLGMKAINLRFRLVWGLRKGTVSRGFGVQVKRPELEKFRCKIPRVFLSAIVSSKPNEWYRPFGEPQMDRRRLTSRSTTSPQMFRAWRREDSDELWVVLMISKPGFAQDFFFALLFFFQAS